MKKFKQRGQVTALFALLMPFFLLFIGLSLDLGWYYLNVSRLQNAADAAALAGAQKIIAAEENFADYKNIALVNKYPGGIAYEFSFENDADQEKIDDAAKEYIYKNLQADSSLRDGYTKTHFELYQQLYTKDDKFYYVVRLKEKIRNFFLAGWFDGINAPVTAVAIISKEEVAESSGNVVEPPSLVMPNEHDTVFSLSRLWLLDRSGTIFESPDRDIIIAKDADGYSTVIRDPNDEFYLVDNDTVKLINGWEIEGKKINQVVADNLDELNPKSCKVYQASEIRKSYNNYRTEKIAVFNENFNSIYINFLADVDFGFEPTEDWDLDENDLRIHGHINFETPFTVRETRGDKKNNPEDILWARIESEVMHGETLNSVRQIVLNINQSNAAENYRPVVMFYDGPETIDAGNKLNHIHNPNDANESSIRSSQPVILNLQEDFRGILFAPNSPVVILGNGHSLEGLVVAKKFVRLATEEDFGSDEEYSTVTDENEIDMIIDAQGNVQTRDFDDDAYTLSKFNLSENSFFSTFNHSFLILNNSSNEKSQDMFFTADQIMGTD